MLLIPSITRIIFHYMSAKRGVIFETYKCEIGDWGSMARLIGPFDTCDAGIRPIFSFQVDIMSLMFMSLFS